MLPQRTSDRRSRILELPEIISGMLVLVVLLWEVCFEQPGSSDLQRAVFIRASHLVLCGLVWFNTATVFIHFLSELWHLRWPGRFVCLQLLVGVMASVAFGGGVWSFLPLWSFWVTLVCSLFMGAFALINLVSYRRAHHHRPGRMDHWSPPVLFFTYMVVLVIFSTLILLTPGATVAPISAVDAFFTCASASSITGLMCIDAAEVLSPLGKLVLLIDIQIGAVGVVTFSMLVLMMVGKRLAFSDSSALSGVLDMQNVNVIPALLKAVFGITFGAELIGAVCLYFLWLGRLDIPQENLVFYAVFHAVSAFCNAGITILPKGMQSSCMEQNYAVQGIMMLLMFIGTMGFGVYLEVINRLRSRLRGQPTPPHWSTSTWLAVRATLIVILLGTLGMGLLSLFEPSVHAGTTLPHIWEALWNSVSRSGGFNLTDLDSYGPVYKLFLCLMMFVGGNPAGTGGGVYAPVFALCVLEIFRVLRGAQDVELHSRRIARPTVERAMATVVLSSFWIAFTTMLLLLIETDIGNAPGGVVRVLLMEVSAFTTTGYDLSIVPVISPLSKIIVALNMLFGRVGMFTFMHLFVRRREPPPLRYPETRLPLS